MKKSIIFWNFLFIALFYYLLYFVAKTEYIIKAEVYSANYKVLLHIYDLQLSTPPTLTISQYLIDAIYFKNDLIPLVIVLGGLQCLICIIHFGFTSKKKMSLLHLVKKITL